jgi:3',5'-cyclic AMP phosphodiesterase CpdA
VTTLAHISDLHVLELEGVSPTRFLNKRATGLVNLLGPRRGQHDIAIMEVLVADLQSQGHDHVLVTGDLTNLALESEFSRARGLLEPIATYEGLSVVPGNHDVYTRGAERQRRFERYFGDLLWPEDTEPANRTYPWYKDVDGVAVIGLSSAHPRLPFIATGEVGPEQLARLEDLALAHDFKNRFAIALVHHNLHERSARKNLMHGLNDRDALLERCEAASIDLILHGHTHVAHRFRHGDLEIIGCGSSTWKSEHPEHVARYNVYHVEDGQLVRVETRVFDPNSGTFGAKHQEPETAQSATL